MQKIKLPHDFPAPSSYKSDGSTQSKEFAYDLCVNALKFNIISQYGHNITWLGQTKSGLLLARFDINKGSFNVVWSAPLETIEITGLRRDIYINPLKINFDTSHYELVFNAYQEFYNGTIK